jgi:plasmid stabilization system protein ParE
MNAPAAKAVRISTAAPNSLLSNPFLGQRLDEFAPRQIRRLIVGQYEMRYEISERTIYILRVWHRREDR